MPRGDGRFAIPRLRAARYSAGTAAAVTKWFSGP